MPALGLSNVGFIGADGASGSRCASASRCATTGCGCCGAAAGRAGSGGGRGIGGRVVVGNSRVRGRAAGVGRGCGGATAGGGATTGGGGGRAKVCGGGRATGGGGGGGWATGVGGGGGARTAAALVGSCSSCLIRPFCARLRSSICASSSWCSFHICSSLELIEGGGGAPAFCEESRGLVGAGCGAALAGGGADDDGLEGGGCCPAAEPGWAGCEEGPGVADVGSLRRACVARGSPPVAAANTRSRRLVQPGT